MNDRERLIELLRKVQDYGIKHTSEEWSVTVECKDNKNIADYLLAHGVTVQRWIPVTERLPETTRLCIASKYNVPFLAWWTGKDWRAADTVTVVDGINYWKELPQPPEENDYEKDL